MPGSIPVPVEAKKRKRSPSGRKLGKRCVPMSVPSGIRDAGTASPPDAGTTKSVPVKVGANTIRSSAPQAPPRASCVEPVSAMARGEPPRRSITLRRRCAKKPSRRPSGDQNGKRASTVPGSSFASVEPSDLTQSAVRPSLPRATKASWRPSDDSASPLTIVVPLGVAISNSACSAAPCVATSGGAAARKARAPSPRPDEERSRGQPPRPACASGRPVSLPPRSAAALRLRRRAPRRARCAHRRCRAGGSSGCARGSGAEAGGSRTGVPAGSGPSRSPGASRRTGCRDASRPRRGARR